jgi:hypothetical protein
MSHYGRGAYGEGPYGIGGDYEALVETDTLDILPDILPKSPEKILRRYVDSHDELLTKTDADFSTVIASKYIGEVEGVELDRVGALFGELGRRRGRNDSQYRGYLRSIVKSFDGRGTNPGIKFAIASVVQIEPDDVQIIEDFVNLEDTIRLSKWEAHSTELIFEVFNLASPSGVSLRAIGEYDLYGSNQEVTIKSTAGNKREGLGSGTIGDNEIGFYE